jgi:Centromere DNA-binding protein complex CBF3 subunit, domain 2
LQEDESFDFTENSNWFKIAVMVAPSTTAESNHTSVSNRQYDKKIRGHLKKLGVHAKHAIHFGRAEGPASLECEEVCPQLIKILGGWNQDTQESAYSQHLPFPALRAAAGFFHEKGFHFNPRTSVEPPEDLMIQIFPFVERVEEQMRQSDG